MLPLQHNSRFFSSKILEDRKVLTAFLQEQTHPRSAIPSETFQISHFMTCFFFSLASSKHPTTIFSSVSHWLTPWRWSFLHIFLLAGKKLMYHRATLVYILSPFFLLLLLLLARKMFVCNAYCTFYMRAFKLSLTGMHSAMRHSTIIILVS